MERTEVASKVRAILDEQKTLPAGALDDATRSLEDLGFDSLDALNIIFAIEEAFGITVDDEEARSLRTIDALIDAVLRRASDSP